MKILCLKFEQRNSIIDCAGMRGAKKSYAQTSSQFLWKQRR